MNVVPHPDDLFHENALLPTKKIDVGFESIHEYQTVYLALKQEDFVFQLRKSLQEFVKWENENPLSVIDNPTPGLFFYNGFRFKSGALQCTPMLDMSCPQAWRIFEAVFNPVNKVKWVSSTRLSAHTLVYLYDRALKTFTPATISKGNTTRHNT